MKTVLFCCYGLGIGGIEKCLVNLINAMPEEDFAVDLLLMNPKYSFLPSIQRAVTQLESFCYVMNTTDTYREIRERGGVTRNLVKTARYVLFRLAVKLGLRSWRTFSPMRKRYDIAVAYSQNDYSPYYVIDKVTADRKIMWYHNGAYEKSGHAYKRDQSYYSRFDYIVAVSQDCKKMLMEKFDFAAQKAVVLKNFYDVDDIKTKALEPLPRDFNSDFINIVTVGRLTREKGADMALAACRHLVSCGRKVRWYWIGDGNQRKKIEKEIEKDHLQETFFLMGDQANPYPYMGAADIYVQPSYYEAYSTTVCEARALGKIIVATDVGGMREQIKSMENGIIAPVDAKAISIAICRLLDDVRLHERIREAAQGNAFDPIRNMEEYKEKILK